MEASVATPGQGAPPAGTPAPGGQGQAGQGQPTAAGKGDGFNWGNFPDVPVEQRELLEPHLRNVQGHVTRIESQYAPYKGLMDTVAPEQVDNVLGFLQGYNENPAATILGIVQQMQQDGTLTPEQLAQLNGAPPQTQQQQPQPGQEEMPEWAQQMQARLAQYEQRDQQQAEQQEQAEQQAILEQATTGIRGQLTTSGISPEMVSDETIVAFIIAHNGDEQAAANAISQMRQNFLADFTNNSGERKEPTVQGQLPGQPKQSGRKDRDGFDAAKAGARQMLEQSARANASG